MLAARWLVAVSLLAVSLLAAACGSSAAAPDSASSTARSATTSAPPRTGAPPTTPPTATTPPPLPPSSTAPSSTTTASTTTPSTSSSSPSSTTTATSTAPTDALLTERPDSGSITLAGVEQRFTATEFDPTLDLDQAPTPAVVGLLGDDDTAGLVVVPYDPAARVLPGDVIIIDAAGDAWFGTGARVAGSGSVITAAGTALRAGADPEEAEFELRIALGVGTSTFELDGTKAIVRGELGAATFEQVRYLLDAHPEVDTIVLADVPGSVNDEVNVETGRLIRAAGLATHVPADGAIYSGGVDLFVAGAERTAAAGATVGVHAWCCGPAGRSAEQLTQSSPEHRSQLDYFSEMLGPELGPAFYFFTLQSASFDEMATMSRAEMEFFGLVADRRIVADERDITATITTLLGDTTFATAADAGAAALARFASSDGDSGGGGDRTGDDADVLVELDPRTADASTTIIGTTGELRDDAIEREVLTMRFDPADGRLVAASSRAVCRRGPSGRLCV